MIWAAYLLFCGVAAAAWFGLRSWIGTPRERVIRGATALIATASFLVGLTGLLTLVTDRAHTLTGEPMSAVLFSSIAVGGGTYLAGTARWDGTGALRLRAAGTLLVIVPIAVPSQLTLGVPLLGLLLATLTKTYADPRGAPAVRPSST